MRSLTSLRIWSGAVRENSECAGRGREEEPKRGSLGQHMVLLVETRRRCLSHVGGGRCTQEKKSCCSTVSLSTRYNFGDRKMRAV